MSFRQPWKVKRNRFREFAHTSFTVFIGSLIMLIKQIDILVHPDFNQISVPNFPLHKLQLAVREKWEKRFNLLKDQDGAVLIYFSIMTLDEINQRLDDPSSILDKIECEEIYRIKNLKEMLGSRFILFGWFFPPSSEIIVKTFTSLGFTVVPEETEVYAYGEIFELCVWAWGNCVVTSLDVPLRNIIFSRGDSLTNDDGRKISRWRFGGD